MCFNQHVVFKDAFPESFIRSVHDACSVLDACLPFSFVVAPIIPINFSVAVSEVHLIVSFVNMPICPGEDSISVFVILKIFALILISVARPFLPHAMSMPQP